MWSYVVQGQIIYKNVTLNKNCETTILRDERIKRVWGREGMFILESGVIKELYDWLLKEKVNR